MLEKAPIKPLRYNNGFWGPQGSHIYYVRDGDDFGSLAKRDGWSDVWDFIDYNFQTRDAKEVNWYLHRFVGCTKTNDGMNYRFSSTDRVRMTDGSSQRGHVFTRKRLLDHEPGKGRDEQARDALIQTLKQYRTLFARLRFEMYGYHFHGSDLNKIREYVAEGRVRVSHRPSNSAEGVYYPGYDALHLKSKEVKGVGEAALIVHECTHAVMDMNYASLTVQQSEAIAYVVQCVIAEHHGMVLYSGRHTDDSIGHEDGKFVVGAEIAEHLHRGNHTVSKSRQNRMLKALKEDPHYGHKSGRPCYDGIPKKETGPYPPVIPYGA